LHVVDKGGRKFEIVVLDQATADKLWRVTVGGKDIVVFTDTTLGLTPSGFELTAAGSSNLNFTTFPSIRVSGATESVHATSRNSIFTTYAGSKQTKIIPIHVTQVRAPGVAPPVDITGNSGATAPTGIATPIGSGGPAGSAIAYNDFVVTTTSGLWSVGFSLPDLVNVDEAWLKIDYQGDQARLYAGDVILDDQFYNGETWLVGLKRLASQAKTGNLTLAIMPLRSDAKIYLQTTPTYGANNQTCSIISITLTTVYSHDITVSA
jgi:beta-galactosidase